MKYFIFVCFLVLAILTNFAIHNKQEVKYNYLVRENIDYYTGGQRFELYCYTEYYSGKTAKKYIANFDVRNEQIGYMTSSLCPKTNLQP